MYTGCSRKVVVVPYDATQQQQQHNGGMTASASLPTRTLQLQPLAAPSPAAHATKNISTTTTATTTTTTARSLRRVHVRTDSDAHMTACARVVHAPDSKAQPSYTIQQQQQQRQQLGTPWVAPVALRATRQGIRADAAATAQRLPMCVHTMLGDSDVADNSNNNNNDNDDDKRARVTATTPRDGVVALRHDDSSSHTNRVTTATCAAAADADDNDDDVDAALDDLVDTATTTAQRRRRERCHERLRDIEATLTRELAVHAQTDTTTSATAVLSRSRAVCAALEAVGDVVAPRAATQSVLRHVCRCVRDMAAALQQTHATHADALATQERSLRARARAFCADKLDTLLRERARAEQTTQQLRDELLAVRQARDDELSQAKDELLRRLAAYERREQDVNYYRQLIATVFHANERLTQYNEQLEAVLRKHRLDVPAPPPDVFVVTGKKSSNNSSNSNSSRYHVSDRGRDGMQARRSARASHGEHAHSGNDDDDDSNNNDDDDDGDDDAPMRPLSQQVPIAFIAASRAEMNAARLTLQKELLHCAFDQRSAYRMQVTGMQHEKAALQAKVVALEERVTELSSYIHAKRYRRSRRRTTQQQQRPLPPPCRPRRGVVDSDDDDDDSDDSPGLADDVAASSSSTPLPRVATASGRTTTAPVAAPLCVRSLDTVAHSHSHNVSKDSSYNKNNYDNSNDNDDDDDDELLTPRPRDVPFAIQTELGVDLKESTAHVVVELAAVSVNLKHQLNSALLRLRQMATLVEWANEATLRDVDARCNDVGVLPLYPSDMWPYIPHFLRTRLGSSSSSNNNACGGDGGMRVVAAADGDAETSDVTLSTSSLSGVPNLRWSATTTAALLRELFDRYDALRDECRYVRDRKMLAPRTYQLSEHCQRRLARVDATRAEVAQSVAHVPFGYVVSHFIRSYLLRQSRDEAAKALQTVLPATVHVRFAAQTTSDDDDEDDDEHDEDKVNDNKVNSSSSSRRHHQHHSRRVGEEGSGGGVDTRRQRVVELEFVRFAYNLWWSAQHHARTQPLCELFCRVVDGQAPVALYALTQRALARVRRCVDALDVDGSGSFTYARLASGVQQLTSDVAAHDTHRGLLAVAQTFADNALPLVGARLRRLPLLADESYCLRDKNGNSNNTNNSTNTMSAAATAVALVGSAHAHTTPSSTPTTAAATTTATARASTVCALMTTHVAPATMPLGASVFVRYWRALVLHYALAAYDLLERLLLPLVRESAVVLGVYLLPVAEAAARLRSLDADADATARHCARETDVCAALAGRVRDAYTHLRHRLVVRQPQQQRQRQQQQQRQQQNRRRRPPSSSYDSERRDEDTANTSSGSGSSGGDGSDSDADDDDDDNESSSRGGVPMVAGMTHEYAQLLEQRHYILQRARSTQCVALEAMFVRSIDALPRLSAAIHFPFDRRRDHANVGDNSDKAATTTTTADDGNMRRRVDAASDASRRDTHNAATTTSARDDSAATTRGSRSTRRGRNVAASSATAATTSTATSTPTRKAAGGSASKSTGKPSASASTTTAAGSHAATTTTTAAAATTGGGGGGAAATHDATAMLASSSSSSSSGVTAALAMFAPRSRELVEWYSFCARLREQLPCLHGDLFACDDASTSDDMRQHNTSSNDNDNNDNATCRARGSAPPGDTPTRATVTVSGNDDSAHVS